MQRFRFHICFLCLFVVECLTSALICSLHQPTSPHHSLTHSLPIPPLTKTLHPSHSHRCKRGPAHPSAPSCIVAASPPTCRHYQQHGAAVSRPFTTPHAHAAGAFASPADTDQLQVLRGSVLVAVAHVSLRSRHPELNGAWHHARERAGWGGG